jgi:hypothetical protein
MALWVQRLHLYSGLLSLTALVVYAAAGLAATFAPEKGGAGATESVRHVRFVASGGDRKVVADRIHAELDLPLTFPVVRRAIRKNASGQWQMRFFTPNGHHEVTVLAKQKRLRISTLRLDMWHFLARLHHVTLRLPGSGVDWRMILWSFYGEFALFSLFWLSASSTYLWWSPRLQRWARAGKNKRRPRRPLRLQIHSVLGVALLPLVGIYAVSALQMTHGLKTDWSLFEWLSKLHRAVGFEGGEFAADLWGGLVIAFSIGLVLIAANGLFLWFRMPRERVRGAIILVLGLGYGVGLIGLIRIA